MRTRAVEADAQATAVHDVGQMNILVISDAGFGIVATAVTFPIQIFVLDPAGLSYLQTIVFILVIAVLVQFIEIFLKKYIVALYNSLGVYLPLITTNCCVLAVTILVVGDYGADVESLGFGIAYIEALICAIGAGVGFMLAMVMFSGVRKRVEACDPPAPFKGLPITLLAAAITSLSFMGFGGLVENLFNSQSLRYRLQPKRP